MQILPAWAQSVELTAAFKQNLSLKQQGKYAQAIPFAKRFIELAKAEFGETHPYYASGLNNLAELYRAQARYGDAEPLYKRSLAIGKTSSSPKHKK